MKVFEIKPDFAYQTFYTSDPDGPEDVEEEYSLDGGSKLATWSPLPMFEADGDLKSGNFAHCWEGGFIVDIRASSVLKPILEKCAELLPLQPYKGNLYHLLNVLKPLDCLDDRRTKWRIGKKHGKRIGIDEYQFIPSKLTNATLFRLPKRVPLFTAVGRQGSKVEFKTIVEREGLTGLKFEEIWSEDGPPIKIRGIIEEVLG
jgi:hypothetical protein